MRAVHNCYANCKLRHVHSGSTVRPDCRIFDHTGNRPNRPTHKHAYDKDQLRACGVFFPIVSLLPLSLLKDQYTMSWTLFIEQSNFAEVIQASADRKRDEANSGWTLFTNLPNFVET